jgi:hypothetical protein
MVGVGRLHHAGNGSAIPGLHRGNKTRQAMQVRVIDIDVAPGANQLELIKDCAKVHG